VNRRPPLKPRAVYGLEYFAKKRNKVSVASESPTAAQRKKRAETFKALGHPARLHMVDILADGERCVCELVDAVGLGWSTVSRHLAVLKAAGVVEDEKRGLQVFYRLALPCVASFSACLDLARRGRKVEVRACCA
jgi:ArsR family transcriptional regulator